MTTVFSVTAFGTIFSSKMQNVVRKQIQIWNLVLIFDRAQGHNFVAVQLFLFHDPIIFERATRGTNESES